MAVEQVTSEPARREPQPLAVAVARAIGEYLERLADELDTAGKAIDPLDDHSLQEQLARLKWRHRVELLQEDPADNWIDEDVVTALAGYDATGRPLDVGARVSGNCKRSTRCVASVALSANAAEAPTTAEDPSKLDRFVPSRALPVWVPRCRGALRWANCKPPVAANCTPGRGRR